MGDLRRYELYVILRPELEEDDIQAFVSQVTRFVEDRNGRVLEAEVKDLRKLSYAIKKVLEGRDVIFQLYLPPGATNEIEHQLRLNETVLRYLTTRVFEEVATVEVPPAEATPEPRKEEKEAETGAEEEKEISEVEGVEVEESGVEEDTDVDVEVPDEEEAPAAAEDDEEEK